MRINLFYLSGNTTGGWVTYTAHLMYGLYRIGLQPMLYKVGNRTEDWQRRFGYDLFYRNLDLREALDFTKRFSTVIVALQKNFRDKAAELLEAGAWMVVHDPAEFANLKLADTGKYITIRKAVAKQVPGSVFIPHPYGRRYPPRTHATGEVHACSISRIDFDKHTEILLDANRKLPIAKRVQINGFENRIYTRFKICPKYPEWEQSKVAYPRERYAAVDLCHKATYSVDMSEIKGDGGGTQYTFLEAMDAGSINVINRLWIIPDDEMVPDHNCLVAGDGDELAKVLSRRLPASRLKSMINHGDSLLRRHHPIRIAHMFKDALTAS